MAVINNGESTVLGGIINQVTTSITQKAAEELSEEALDQEAEAVKDQAEAEVRGRGGKGQLKKLLGE